MLGNKVGMLLVVAVVSFAMISEIFAESILVEFDKSEYNTGNSFGRVGHPPVAAVSSTSPQTAGRIERENITAPGNHTAPASGTWHR